MKTRTHHTTRSAVGLIFGICSFLNFGVTCRADDNASHMRFSQDMIRSHRWRQPTSEHRGYPWRYSWTQWNQSPTSPGNQSTLGEPLESMFHPSRRNVLWLQGYLDSLFTPAAEALVYDRDPKTALRLLAKIMAQHASGSLVGDQYNTERVGHFEGLAGDYAHHVASQWHYLKALCLQSLGSFRESTFEYRLVQKLTSDEILIGKARLGQTLAERQDRELTQEQIEFPGTAATISPDIE